jgi:hypothetical protein
VRSATAVDKRPASSPPGIQNASPPAARAMGLDYSKLLVGSPKEPPKTVVRGRGAASGLHRLHALARHARALKLARPLPSATAADELRPPSRPPLPRAQLVPPLFERDLKGRSRMVSQ